MKRDLVLATTLPARRIPIISSRFAGPSIRRDSDGTFEEVLPEFTVDQERLQDALIAWSEPQLRYERGLFGLTYPGARQVPTNQSN